jgi:hypothetical protein
LKAEEMSATPPAPELGFDPARRDRINTRLRAWLRERKLARVPERTILAVLEYRAEVFRGLPAGPRIEEDEAPEQVRRAARALQLALARHGDQPGYDYDTLSRSVFRRRLAELAGNPRPRARPRNLLLRSVEVAVLDTFEVFGLPFRGSQYAADILAEVKAHALGTEVPRTPEARRTALQRAHRRRSAET